MPYYSCSKAKVGLSRLTILLFHGDGTMACSWFCLFRAKNLFLSSSSWILKAIKFLKSHLFYY
jgi:hypothetical protein